MSDDVEGVSALLAEGFPRTSTPFWRGVLAYPWLAASDKPDFGVVLEVGGAVEGYLGAMYSDRPVAGRVERFCNVFGLYVREAHRRHAIPLIAALVRRPGLTFVNVTAADNVVPIFTRLGFAPPSERRLLVPGRVGTVLRGRGGVRVVGEDDVTPALLGDDVFRIYADHFGRTFSRTVAEAGGRTCLLMSGRTYVPGRRGAVVSLHYASDRAFLARHFDAVLLRLLSLHKATALVAEEHVLGFAPPGASEVPRGGPPGAMLYKSASVPASEVTGLYTELAMLP